MNKNLNDDLYSRFGLKLEENKVKQGFNRFVKNLFEEELAPVISPAEYDDSAKLYEIHKLVLKESCRQMFLDSSKYEDWDYGFGWFLDKVFDYDFDELILRLQILMNVLFKFKLIGFEVNQFAQKLDAYLHDYPILSLTVKLYKRNAPQVFPTTSEVFEKEIKNTLGILELNKKYSDVLNNFEEGLREFLKANKTNQLKDVVEDMYTSCDLTIQVYTGATRNGLRHVFVGKTPVQVGLNKWQLSIYNEMRDWMDKIKHGVEKNYSREDVEQIILLVSSFIRKVIK